MAERARPIRQKVPELVAAGATVIREELYDDVSATSSCRTPKATSSASLEQP